MKKEIVYFDMDNCMCDFRSAALQALVENPLQPYPQSQWGFFLKLKPLPGAIESFHYLAQYYDVYILTRPSFRNVNCYTEKAQWVWDNLGYEYVEKLVLSPNKTLSIGDYLIDDTFWDFTGEFVHFGQAPYEDWSKVRSYFTEKIINRNKSKDMKHDKHEEAASIITDTNNVIPKDPNIEMYNAMSEVSKYEMVKDCESFDDLRLAVKSIGKFKGSKMVWDADYILRAIDIIDKGQIDFDNRHASPKDQHYGFSVFNGLTRGYGLRQQAIYIKLYDKH